MARMFSIARALCLNHAYVMQGALSESGDVIYGTPVGKDVDPGFCRIDTSSLTFNTGFLDSEGKEIFTGDYINTGVYCISGKVVFDEEAGAFFLTVRGYKEEVESNTDAPGAFIRHKTYSTYFYPFNRSIGKQSIIVGNIYDELVKSDESIETGERHDD